MLAVALGADYDPAAAPGFVADGHEYYSVAGAERLREVLPSFSGGNVLIAILGVPFKCPPAPFEGALLLHDYLVDRGVRDATRIDVISAMELRSRCHRRRPWRLVHALAERDIGYTGHEGSPAQARPMRTVEDNLEDLTDRPADGWPGSPRPTPGCTAPTC